MEQLEAVLHAALLQRVEAGQDLRNRQPELRAVAAGALPAPAAARRQLHPHADLRPHAHFLAVLENQLELGVLLDDGDDGAAHLGGQHHRLDVLRVLEAVADDGRVVVRHRDDRQQLRLAAGLEAEAVRRAEVEHFLHDLPLLVHLDRVDAAIAPAVLVLGDCGLERVVDIGEAVPEDVAEPDEQREVDAACLKVVGQPLQVNRPARLLGGMDLDVAGAVDREVTLAPAGHLVEFARVGGAPDLTGAYVLEAPARCAHGE